MSDEDVRQRLDQMGKSIDGILSHLHEGAYKFGGIEKLMDRLETSVRKLEVIVLEGNHRPSIVAQVEAMKAMPTPVPEKKATFLGTTAERVALITATGAIIVATLGLMK